MARSALRDPLDKYRWTVKIEGFTKLGFHQTSAPGYNITTKKYKEGGAHLTPRQIIDTIDYKPVTLTRGVSNDTSFNRWATSFIDLVTNNAAFYSSSGQDVSIGGKSVQDLGTSVGLGPNDPLIGTGSNIIDGALNGGGSPVHSFIKPPVNINPLADDTDTRYRKTVKIEHTNRAGQVEVVYMLYGAFPIEYTPASDFGAMDDDGVSIESITLAYESFEVLYAGISGAFANILSNS
jgi:hypothetical protein